MKSILKITFLGLGAIGVLFAFFLTQDSFEFKRSDLVGKWCLNKGSGEAFLVLRDNGSFVTSDSIPNEQKRWSLKTKDEPLGPALAIDNFKEGGVFPLTRNDGRFIFIIDPDENIYYGKCD